MNPEPVRIFVTGGTFDKEYNELNGALFFKDTHLPEMLRLGRSRVGVSITTLMMIDSLDMTDSDRARIVEQCAQASESRMVVSTAPTRWSKPPGLSRRRPRRARRSC
jgi:L-asparaginase